MREYVYVSDRKLRAFIPEPKRRRWFRRLGIRGDLGIPGVAQVGIDMPTRTEQADHSTLHSVRTYLENTPGKLRDHREEGLQPGQWIRFKTRLNHIVLHQPEASSVLLFVDINNDGRRLLLHGSPQHLMDNASLPIPPSESAAGIGVNTGNASEATDVFPPLLAQLARLDDRDKTMRRKIDGPGLTSLLVDLDKRLDPRAARWLSGYARVTLDTADLGVVVASPLYVEFAISLR